MFYKCNANCHDDDDDDYIPVSTLDHFQNNVCLSNLWDFYHILYQHKGCLIALSILIYVKNVSRELITFWKKNVYNLSMKTVFQFSTSTVSLNLPTYYSLMLCVCND